MSTDSGKIDKFKNHQKQLKAPWVIYADFESLINKIEGPSPCAIRIFTQRTNLHEACGYCIRPVRSDGYSPEYVLYRGPEFIKHFLEDIKKVEKQIRNSLKYCQKIARLTTEETKAHDGAKTYWICEESGFDEYSRKVCFKGQQELYSRCFSSGDVARAKIKDYT